MSVFGLPNKTFNCLSSTGPRSCRKSEPLLKGQPSSLRKIVSMVSQLALGPALRNSPKQDLHSLSPANFVFGGPARLPGEFFAPEADAPTPTHDYISNFSKYIANLAYHQPRATHRHSHLDPTLFSSQCSHVYIRTDTYKPPLAPHYRGLFPVISKNDKYFVIDFRTHNDVVSIEGSQPLF